MSVKSLNVLSNIRSLPPQAPTACYDVKRSYEENRDNGPFLALPYPTRHWAPEESWTTLFDLPIASALGVPAGPLLDSKWIAFATQLGFDILTYKTIRSHGHKAHPAPNVVFVEPTIDISGQVAIRKYQAPSCLTDIAITNSFGNPSSKPDVLQQDIAASRAALHRGQVLIVSVFGTGETLQQLAADYVRAANIAAEAGAHSIEINLSCPNLSKEEGSLFMNEEASSYIVKQVVQAVNPLPVVVKVGIFSQDSALEKALINWTRAGARGLCGINTIPMRIEETSGQPSLGPERPIAGVCGNPIRKSALHFASTARKAIRRNKLDLTLLSCGGITLPEHVDAFLEAGSEAALTATGMMWDPYIALRWHDQQQKKESQYS